MKGEPTLHVIQQLRNGVKLDDGLAKPLEADLVSHTEKNTWIKLVVAEGRPHLVKRLCEAVGHPVVRLFRSSYAGITVDGMMAGELRELSGKEVRGLRGRLAAPGEAGEDKATTLPPRRDARRTANRPRPAGRGRRSK